jgi:hypothetical protein
MAESQLRRRIISSQIIERCRHEYQQDASEQTDDPGPGFELAGGGGFVFHAAGNLATQRRITLRLGRLDFTDGEARIHRHLEDRADGGVWVKTCIDRVQQAQVAKKHAFKASISTLRKRDHFDD